MVFRICTYERISGFHVVNIFGLNENLYTVCQNSCSNYQTGRVVKVFEIIYDRIQFWKSFRILDTPLLKIWLLCRYFSIISSTDLERIFCKKPFSSYILPHSFVERRSSHYFLNHYPYVFPTLLLIFRFRELLACPKG